MLSHLLFWQHAQLSGRCKDLNKLRMLFFFFQESVKNPPCRVLSHRKAIICLKYFGQDCSIYCILKFFEYEWPSILNYPRHFRHSVSVHCMRECFLISWSKKAMMQFFWAWFLKLKQQDTQVNYNKD